MSEPVYLARVMLQQWLSTRLYLMPLVLLLGILLYRGVFHPLARFPGPVFARYTGLWRTYRYARGTWHDDVLQLHRQYGRAVRIAPNELSLVDENAMRQLYGHGKGTRKTDWYHTWDVRPVIPAVFAETDNKTHAFLRRRLAAAYSMSNILRYEPYIQSVLDLLFERLAKHATKAGSDGALLDMSEWTNALAFDVIGELGYGEQLGQLRTETDVMNIRSTILQGFYIQANMGHLWGQKSYIDNAIVDKLCQWLGIPNPFMKFMSWSNEKVRMRREGGKETEREDMLTHFIKMKEADGSPASHDSVLMECLTLIGAGADTTSVAMRSCLYYLGLNPESYRRVQQEVDEYYTKHQLSGPISYLQTQQLPYLQAVVREATRLLPSIVYQLLRHAPPGLVVDGYVIPKDTPVGISPIAQNRDRAIWGANADDFCPERWLDEGNARKLDALSMTFGGSGPRMCVGRNIALVEVSKFVAQLLHNFDVEISNPSHPWRIQSIWFAHQRDFWMKVRRRPERLPHLP